jgi:hypothetical protein
MEYWSEKYNQIPTFIPGEQSKVYPNALPGLVYPDRSGSSEYAGAVEQPFSPRLGWRGRPARQSASWERSSAARENQRSRRLRHFLFRDRRQHMAFDEPQPPYGLSYTSPGPPLFATPFITRRTASFSGNPFPLTFPPLKRPHASQPQCEHQFHAVRFPSPE